ncbi:MAG: ribonuclease HI, partial [Moorea sp. SIO3C2]|nr:ribonuclease HI [Moorena sp. SIO3C2]
AHLSNGQIHEIGGASRYTAHPRLEIQAAIEILQWFEDSIQSKEPRLYTDSIYVQDGITKWIKGWKKTNWKTTAGKPVLNQDLWQQLDAITQTINAQLETPVQWRYVKGHAGNEGNERCDAIARQFSKGGHPALMTVTPWTSEQERSLASAAVEEGNQDSEPEHSQAQQKSAPVLATKKETRLSADPVSLVQSGESKETSQRSVPSINSDTDDFPPPSHSPHHQLNHMIERLRIADEIAQNGYWITTPELAQLLDLPLSTLEKKDDRWLWRNWSILKVHQGGSPSLWHLERVD